MSADVSSLFSTLQIVLAAFLAGAAVGFALLLTCILKFQSKNRNKNNKVQPRATCESNPLHADRGSMSSAPSSMKQSQHTGTSTSTTTTTNNNNNNNNGEFTPRPLSVRALAAQQLSQAQTPRSSSINLILKSCLGAEGLADEVVTEVNDKKRNNNNINSAEETTKGREEEKKREHELFLDTIRAVEEDDATDSSWSRDNSVERADGYNDSGSCNYYNYNNYSYNEHDASLSPMDLGSSDVSTLDGLFSDNAASPLHDDGEEEDHAHDEESNNNNNNNNNSNSDSTHAPKEMHFTSTFGQYGDGAASLGGDSEKNNVSACGESSDANMRFHSLAQGNHAFSKRQFYHTHSGAIITRLPSVASVRCRSILQHLQFPASSSSHRESTEDESSRSQLQSARSTKSLLDDPIYRVVITGGPCSGKTSCLAYLRRVFEKLNFNVFCVPEVATLLHSGGVNLVLQTQEDRITQQRVILQMMMMLEDAFYELASMRSRPSLILYDRGTMDGSAYCSEEEWAAVLAVTGYTSEELSDARYDAVVHLVTAASGAEEFYTLENNAARSEGVEEARRLDARTLNAWRGHYLVSVVGNEGADFEKKMRRVAEFIGCVTGISTIEDITAVSASSVSPSAKDTEAAAAGAAGVGVLQQMSFTPSTYNNNNDNNNEKGEEPAASTSSSSVLLSPSKEEKKTGEQDKHGGGHGKGEGDVARMAFLATGTRAFATSASVAAGSVHSPRNDTSKDSAGDVVRNPREPPFHSTVMSPERTPLHPLQSPAAGLDSHAGHGGLQRHFFVNHVNSARIPADAIVSNVVTITIIPLRAEYRTEVIIRLCRANNTRPLYLRRVEYQDAETTPQSADTNTTADKKDQHSRGRHLARVQITKAAFLKLARRKDPAQPVIQKTTKRFFYNMKHFTLVTFQHPKELRGVCRLVAPADTTEEDIGDLAEVEPFSLLMREGVM